MSESSRDERPTGVADDDVAISTTSSSLTRKQILDIIFLVLAFSCVVAAMTLVVGTGAIVVQSVGGDVTLAPFALAAFFLGMSIVSLTVTHWVFQRWGRRKGLWCGCTLSLMGVLLSCIGVYLSSTVLILVANLFLGAGSGIGMYLRFAAVEVVPLEFQSRAMTWVLCGGCLASFAGPEAADATKGKFGNESNMEYFGVFVVAGCFNLAQAIFVRFVGFPPSSIEKQEENTPRRIEGRSEDKEKSDTEQSDITTHTQSGNRTPVPPPLPTREFESILKHSDFILPVLVATLTWSIMAMPMSIFRVAMKEMGYTARQSLTVIECHFLSMYAPGFFSGAFIKTHGFIKATYVAIVMFVLATCVNGFATQDNNNTTVPWYLGLILLGIGWNFGFSGASMWVTRSYMGSPHLKAKVQAANECLVFLFSGAFIFSTGYIYDSAGGEEINGWKTLNYVIFGLVAFLIVVVITATIKMNGKEKRETEEKELGPGAIEDVDLLEADESADVL